ncbi:MAG: class I SAM-dependent methyltransferase [Planctomycetota bacterium]|jgi:cyclopropane fatty-acyl-phospholipid synthase-like methyltransferase
MSRKPKKRKTKGRTAKNSNKFELYELSVQEPEADCDFIEQAWKELKGSQPKSLREDFCGTAITAIEWVKRDETHTGIGIDLDAPTLEVARRRIKSRLKDTADHDRMRLLEDNVLTVDTAPVDCILATNFSYYIFKERAQLREYFEAAYRGIKPGGMMIMDAYGGSESFLEMEEPRECEGFTYVWDQDYYSPVTGHVVNHIHFEFDDGSKMEKAFTYEWRLWTLPEIQEILKEAGFTDVTIYWEGTEEDSDEGNGEWSVTKTGDADKGWVAYIVAEK